MHSAFISLSFTSLAERWVKSRYRYFRIVYNGFSVVTLVAVLTYIMWLQTMESVVLTWPARMVLIRYVLIGVALFFFAVGARRYDISYFLGISQVKGGRNSVILGTSPDFQTQGVSGLTRHPWYLGGMILLWSVPADFYPSTLITATIFSCYFLVGTILEERKLLIHFGESYRAYQQKVPMFFSIRRHRH